MRHPNLVTPVQFPQNRGKRAALDAGFRRARGEVAVLSVQRKESFEYLGRRDEVRRADWQGRLPVVGNHPTAARSGYQLLGFAKRETLGYRFRAVEQSERGSGYRRTDDSLLPRSCRKTGQRYPRSTGWKRNGASYGRVDFPSPAKDSAVMASADRRPS